jgi:uncharacterized membrane protein
LRAVLTVILLSVLSTPALALDASGDGESSPAGAAAASATAASATPAGTAAASSAESPALPSPAPTDAAASGAVVRGVFFFSPTCPHCEAVITEHLPGLFESHGGEPSVSVDETAPSGAMAFYLMSNGRLQLLMVDVSVDAGARMFVSDAQRLGLGEAGVPLLAIGDGYLGGSVDIPEQLPGIVDAGLAGAGIGWPPVDGLAAALAAFPEAGDVPGMDDARTSDVILPTGDQSALDKVTRDPVGNGLAILVLLVLVASLVAVPLMLRGDRLRAPLGRQRLLVPVLAVVGIVVAAYLGWVESNSVDAVCGPVGDCNAVQDSDYAVLLGLLPTWVLGIVGYALILGCWAVSRLLQGSLADATVAAITLVAYGGTVFSAWLTFLEPFVIGATCMWCITSALAMLAILWLSAADGWAALRRLLDSRRTLSAS